MIRLFAALWPPPDIAEGLVRRQQGLPGARWLDPDSLHVTLRFFGDIPEDKAEDLDGELSLITEPAPTITLQGVGCFGEGRQIESVWAGLAPNPELDRLASRCETAARRAGLKAETRAFRPHMTLARVTGAEPTRVGAWIQGHNLLKSPPFVARAFGLYSSRRGSQRSVYTLERHYLLG